MRLLLLSALALTFIHAQDLATRESVMQYLRDTLAKEPQLKWGQVPTKAGPDVKPTNVTSTISDIATDAAACTVSFKSDRDFPDDRYRAAMTWKLPVRDIDKVTVETLESYVNRFRSRSGGPAWETKTIPAVYVLSISALPDRKFPAHRWSRNAANEVVERDQETPDALIAISDEAVARGIARALERAKDLCAQ
jgi:hypothetical protein